MFWKDKEEIIELEAEDLWWRPTKMTTKTVTLLLNAFSNWFTDNEACVYAGISKNTLYRYIEKNPEFWNQKELLKDKPKMKAKMNIINSINNKDIETSKWYLERKSKDEFSTKVENEITWELKTTNAVDKLNNLLNK